MWSDGDELFRSRLVANQVRRTRPGPAGSVASQGVAVRM